MVDDEYSYSWLFSTSSSMAIRRARAISACSIAIRCCRSNSLSSFLKKLSYLPY